jgi:hypothetical protein
MISTMSREAAGRAANRPSGRAATSELAKSERTAGSSQRHPVEIGVRMPSCPASLRQGS